MGRRCRLTSRLSGSSQSVSLWENCLLAADGIHRTRIEEVIRCQACHAPRCGHSVDDDPCMLVRHHGGLHLYLSGQTEPVGGISRWVGGSRP